MRLNPRQIAIALAVTGAAVTTTANAARDTIQIAGSSTVLPFASVVAEEFGNTFPQFKTPVVGSGGSSAGLQRRLCCHQHLDRTVLNQQKNHQNLQQEF